MNKCNDGFPESGWARIAEAGDPEEPPFGIPAWVWHRTGARTAGVVLADPDLNGRFMSLLIVTRPGDRQPHGLFSIEEGRKSIRVEALPIGALEDLSRKLKMNCDSFPGFRLLAKAAYLGVESGEGTGTGEDRRLPRLKAWPRPAGWLIDFARPVLAALGKYGVGSKVKIRYVSERELAMVSKMQNWHVFRGGKEVGAWLKAQQGFGMSLELALMHLIHMQRYLEDVHGMNGVRCPASVLISARTAFFHLAMARAAAEGIILDTEYSLAAWDQARTGLPGGPPAFEGFFPVLDQAERFLAWFQEESRKQVESLERCAPLKLLLRGANTLVRNDLRPTTLKSLRQAEYAPPPRVRNRQDLDIRLSQYGISSEELLARVPHLGEEDTVLMTGSVPKGLGHPRSDLDLIVLARTLPEPAGGIISLADGHMECYCRPSDRGNPVCAEYFSNGLLADAARWWSDQEGLAAAAAKTGPEGFDSLMMLRTAHASPYAKIIDRALNGFILRKGRLQSEWEAAIPQRKFAEMICVSHFLEGVEGLRKAFALPEKDLRGRASCGRMAWESLLCAILADTGEFIWSKRWIPEELARHGDAALVSEGLRGLFPSPEESHGYLDDLRIRYGSFLETLRSRPSMAGIWRRFGEGVLLPASQDRPGSGPERASGPSAS